MTKAVVVHILCWLAFAFSMLFRDVLLDSFPAAVAKSLSFLVPTVSLFYTMAYAITPLLTQRKIAAFLFWSVVAILGYLILRGGLKDYLMVNNWEKPDAIPFYLLNTWNGFIFEITACGYYLAQKYYREEQNRQQLQTELLHAELAFLKSQTNPHFLYNSLNFIYSQAISVSEPLSKSVLLLSDIMRYALEEADTQGFVPLAKEIKHLENFIEIHRLRFKHKLQVDYRVSLSEAESERRMVLPFVLISLVENAFKHGLVTKAETPLTIHLSLDAGILRFYVKNKMDKNAEKHPTHGVGLKNLERMLTIAYPQKHRLILIEEQDFFIATLELNYLK